MMSPESAWKATLGELELQMTKATFNTWLKDARLLDHQSDAFVIGVRNDYAKDWLENRLHDTIGRTLSAIVGQKVNLKFEVAKEARPVKNGHGGNGSINGYGPVSKLSGGGRRSDMNQAKHAAASQSAFYRGDIDLKDEYVFSTFVVGQSNRLAHAAALSVAENPGQTYNPLFIYGGVGLGKTHLLHAIGHKLFEQDKTVCYVTSETFTNDLIQSIRSQQMEQFRERYRTPDVLIIDDIQFIAGKESTQEELFHTFNDLHSRGKQVVISSDRPPKAMATLQERLQSRFEWGLMADVQIPDVETRMAILRSKAEMMSSHVPNAVIELIAQRVRQNIRELEGALNKVVAYSQLTGSPIDDHLARMALADMVNKNDRVTIDQIIECVAEYYQINRDALLGAGRSRAISFPRQMVMYLARTETDASFPQIGASLGGRDHTTVLHGYDKINELVETDASIRQDMMSIKSKLYN